jgi:hypothetical protein
VARSVVAVLAGTLFLAGCGGGGHARRDAVNTYFDRVDAAQITIRVHSSEIQQALSSFTTTGPSAARARSLAHARALLVRTGARIAAVPAPPDAAPIRRDLTRLYAMQASVAGELIAMTRFAPAYRRALTPVQPAHAALTADLKRAKGYAALGATFARYRSALEQALAALEKLHAPATLRPSFDAQQRQLRQSIELSAAVEAALAKKSAKATSAALRRLVALGTDGSVAQAQRAEADALKAYNARLVRVYALQRRIGLERTRLVRALG